MVGDSKFEENQIENEYFVDKQICSPYACYQGCDDQGNPHGCKAKCDSIWEDFNEWFKNNQDISWTSDLEPCPCTLDEDCLDKKKWRTPTTELHGFHEGASKCMRSVPKNGHANQCCYTEDGDLITSGGGQGSADLSAAELPTLHKHPVDDVYPAQWAKFLDAGTWGDCSRAYLTVRPQVHNCNGK